MRSSSRCVTACLLTISLLLLSACDRRTEREAAAMTGGDPSRGKVSISYYGCSSCHTIPGIRGADALAGPPLDRIASRTYIGGVVQNTPDNMMQWVKDPRHIDPKTAMPNLHVKAEQARDIAAYLYTLQ